MNHPMARFGALLLGAAFSSATAAALAQSLIGAPIQTDFDGVWQISKPTPRLLTTAGETPPLLPTAAAIYAKTAAQLAAGDRSFDPSSTICKPPGEPRTANEACLSTLPRGRRGSSSATNGIGCALH